MSETETLSRPRVKLGERAVIRNDAPGTSGDLVTICCKWPNGIVMRLYEIIEDTIEVQGRKVTEFQSVLNPEWPEYVLNGFSIDLGKMAGGIPPEHEIRGGFGLTHGIPKDFAKAWFEQNKLNPLVKNGLVFMANTENEGRAKAKEFAGLKSGLEPIDPANPAERAGLRKGTIVKENSAG